MGAVLAPVCVRVCVRNKPAKRHLALSGWYFGLAASHSIDRAATADMSTNTKSLTPMWRIIVVGAVWQGKSRSISGAYEPPRQFEEEVGSHAVPTRTHTNNHEPLMRKRNCSYVTTKPRSFPSRLLFSLLARRRHQNFSRFLSCLAEALTRKIHRPSFNLASGWPGKVMQLPGKPFDYLHWSRSSRRQVCSHWALQTADLDLS